MFPGQPKTFIGSKSLDSALSLKTVVDHTSSCRGENTVAFGKRLNNLRREIVLDAAQESTVQSKGIKAKRFIHTENGQGLNGLRSEKSPLHDLMIPALLVDGVVSTS